MPAQLRYVAYESQGSVRLLVQDADGEKLRDLADLAGVHLGAAAGSDYKSARAALRLAKSIIADHLALQGQLPAPSADEIYRLAKLIRRHDWIFQVTTQELTRFLRNWQARRTPTQGARTA